jgi:TRAP-type mannitol/chloroaromatic compound transport system substrate-binding protein
MRRRDILAGVGSLAAGAASSFPAPAIAQGLRQLKMVTDWPESLTGFHPSSVRFAQMVGAATGGRIKIEVFPAGTLVRPIAAPEGFKGLRYRMPGAGAEVLRALSLRKLRDEGGVKIVKFDDSVLKALLTISRDVVAEIGSGDELSRKIYASYEQFRTSITDWSDIAERAFLNARGLG